MAQKLKFYHLTDLHLNTDGSKHNNNTLHIIDGAFNQLIDDKDVDIIFISGDLTDNGSHDSHRVMLEKLQKLKDAGKRVFVTLATHDYFMNSEAYSRKELREMYNGFGWNEAYSEYVPSYSYAVKLCDGWRLLALNDDGDGRDFCGYYDDELQWIKAQLDDAAKCGEQVVAMTHHPILPPNEIYPFASHRDMLGGYETTGPFLAENGLKYLFVGHTHMQDIRYIEAENGNRMWQVNTGSLTQYPAVFRLVTQCDTGLDVKSVGIDKKYCRIGSKSAYDYLRLDFDYMLQDHFYSAAYDMPHFADLSVGLSMDRDAVYKLRHVLSPIGKFLYRLTFKKAGRLLGVSRSIDPSIADKTLREFFLCAAGNIFSGNENFSPDTPEYRAITAIVGRFAPLVKLRDSEGNRVDLVDFVAKIIYDDGPDDENAVLEDVNLIRDKG